MQVKMWSKSYLRTSIIFIDIVTNHKSCFILKSSENWIKNIMNSNKKFIDFEILAENSLLGICVLNKDGLIIYVNTKLCKLCGYSKEELLKMKFTELLHPEYREFLVAEVNRKSIRRDRLSIYKIKIIDKHGVEKYLEGYIYPVNIGKDIYILGQMLDVTDKHKMEREFKRREESLRRVLENSNLGYFEVDLAGNLLYANEAIAKLLGYPKEKLIGMNNREYTPPEYAKKVFKIFNKVFREEKPATFFDWKIQTFKEKERFVETSVDLMYNEKGEKIGFRGIVRDITQEYLAKQKLEEQEKYYRTLFEGAASPMVIFEGYTIIDANKAFEKFSGYSKKELLGKFDWTKFVDKKDLPRIREYQQKRRIDPSSVPIQYEFTFIDKYNNKKYVISTATFLPNGHFLVSLIDVTERKQLEEKLRFISFHDPLTGLYNRYYFEEEFNRLKNCRCLPVVLIIADLDGLKYVNDTFGHKAGDEYIKACAKILKSSVRNSDVVARLGGDEFGIILPQSGAIAAKKVILRINESICKFNKEKKLKFQISLSIGFAVSSIEKLDPNKLFREADDAMYIEKQRKKQRKEYLCTR